MASVKNTEVRIKPQIIYWHFNAVMIPSQNLPNKVLLCTFRETAKKLVFNNQSGKSLFKIDLFLYFKPMIFLKLTYWISIATNFLIDKLFLLQKKYTIN